MSLFAFDLDGERPRNVACSGLEREIHILRNVPGKLGEAQGNLFAGALPPTIRSQ
jgi:hypothetical protein